MMNTGNTLFDYIAMGVLVIITIVQTWIIIVCLNMIKKLRADYMIAFNSLISEETKRKAAHTKAFEHLTDQEAIIDEMNRGADIHEARQANRLTMPRPDAGPPAIVRKARLRTDPPNFYNRDP